MSFLASLLPCCCVPQEEEEDTSRESSRAGQSSRAGVSPAITVEYGVEAGVTVGANYSNPNYQEEGQE